MASSGLSADKSPDHSSSKLKQKKEILFKKKMFCKKPDGIPSRFNNKVQFRSPKKSIIRLEQKVEKASNPRGCVEQNTSPMKSVEKTSNPRGCVEQNTSPMNKVEKASNPRGFVEQNTLPMKKVVKISNPRGCVEQNTPPVNKVVDIGNPRGCVEQNTSPVNKVVKISNPRGCVEQNTSPMSKVVKTSNPRGCVEQNTLPMKKVVKSSNPRGCVEQNTAPMKKVKKTSHPRGCVEQNTLPMKKVEKTSTPRVCVDQDTPAMKRALEVQENLPLEFPSMVKFMLRSHVTGGFWLGLPLSFARAHLPKDDVTLVLVGENGEYDTKYLKEKNGLSGGWRGFSIAHNLLEGDVLIFQLIEPCKFKVHIVRANNLAQVDGAISLLKLDIDSKPIDQIETNMEICDKAHNEYLESPKSSNHQDDDDQERGIVLNSDHELLLNLSGNDSDDVGSDVLEGIRFSDSAINFGEVKSFKRFNILVDGLIIDSEVPIHIQHKYYDLCCSQKSFIHDHLVGGLNCKLAAGIISETVNIADAIRSAKLTTSCDLLQTWDKTLKAFEDLGMGVGFLRERLKMLGDISSEQQKKIESKKLERAQVEEEMRVLESKLLNIKEAMKNLNSEIEAIKVDGKRFEQNFEEVASAQW